LEQSPIQVLLAEWRCRNNKEKKTMIALSGVQDDSPWPPDDVPLETMAQMLDPAMDRK